MSAGDFAAIGLTLYAAHHVGDYWIQTDEQARNKGATGAHGVLHCLEHVLSYLATQTAFLLLLALVTDVRIGWLDALLGLLVSGVTHYVADRRTPLVWIVNHLTPWNRNLMALGKPREPQMEEVWGPCPTCEGRGTSYDESTGGKCWDCRGGGMLPGHVVITDNPQLATGAWALDQSWHIFWGVFVAALIIAGVQ